ncbi:MAG: type II secretion system protein N [Gammaproteobacteria bacterium]
MKNRWSWLAVGVGAYLAFALSTFPAGTAVHWFVPPPVLLSGIQGTVWSGSAASGTIGGLSIQDVRWHVRPWTLLTGRVGANVEARLADGFLNTGITASPSRVQFSDLRGGTSLATVASLLPVRGLSGQATVALSSLELENGWPAHIVGELKLAALQVAAFVPSGKSGSLVPLGDYTVTFGEAPARSIGARFIDNGGPLEVAGMLALSAAREYTFDALIKPRDSASRDLVDGLNIMTSDPDSNGRRRLTLTGSL